VRDLFQQWSTKDQGGPARKNGEQDSQQVPKEKHGGGREKGQRARLKVLKVTQEHARNSSRKKGHVGYGEQVGGYHKNEQGEEEGALKTSRTKKKNPEVDEKTKFVG